MNETIAKGFYDSIVKEAIRDYDELLNNKLNFSYGLISQCKPWIDMYASLCEEDKKILISLVRQVIIDTTSHIFGIIDGPCTFSISNTEFKLLINDEDSNMEMQDSFLAYIEGLEEGNDSNVDL